MHVLTNSISDILIFSRDEQPFGRTWEEWTTKWWQWFLSVSRGDNPAYDKSGEKGSVDQNDPDVWFLAGTTGGTAERTITAPAGKAILFPIINVTTSFSENPSLKTDEELTSFAKSHIDEILKKEASVDGEDLIISEKNRVQSPPFDFIFPDDNIYRVPSGYTRGVGDGYWVFLKPLTPGNHTIKTSGSCMSGRVRIDVKVNLIVKNNRQ